MLEVAWEDTLHREEVIIVGREMNDAHIDRGRLEWRSVICALAVELFTCLGDYLVHLLFRRADN